MDTMKKLFRGINVKWFTRITLLTLLTIVISAPSALSVGDKTDTDISNAVENELLINSTTPSYLIDAETINGIVTLSGTVDNILARDRAVKIARTVKGVRGVVNEINVDVPYRTNSVLERDIQNALLFDPATESYEVKVTATNGNVTLDGKVQSWQEKQLAEHVTKGVKGVKSIENKISVDWTMDRPDTEIKAEVEQTLQNDIRVDNALIDVKVNDGKVTLEGIVGSNAETFQAESDAWVAGVRSVNISPLKIKEWARDDKLRKNKYVAKTDDEIKNAVKEAFLYDPRVISFNPTVGVNKGVVTLTGYVDNLKAKRAAEKDARNVVGVFSVKNYLKVRPTIESTDLDIENDVSDALLRNPYVDKYDIDVEVTNGVVTLDGTVDNYFEKIKADDIASKTKGTIGVDNNIEVKNFNNDAFSWGQYGWNSFYPTYYVEPSNEYISDYELKENIESELWWSPYVNEDEVNVRVIDGEAYLTGTVDTEREKLYAEINAIEGGANEVSNNLDVSFTPGN